MNRSPPTYNKGKPSREINRKINNINLFSSTSEDSSEMTTQESTNNNNDLNSLFFSMKINDHHKSKKQNIDDIINNLEHLSLGKHKNTNNNDIIEIASLIDGLQKCFRINRNTSPAVEEMYMDIAKAMFKCRLSMEMDNNNNNTSSTTNNSNREETEKEDYDNDDDSRTTVGDTDNHTTNSTNSNNNDINNENDLKRSSTSDSTNTNTSNKTTNSNRREELLKAARASYCDTTNGDDDSADTNNNDLQNNVECKNVNIPFDELKHESLKKSKNEDKDDNDQPPRVLPKRIPFDEVPSSSSNDEDNTNNNVNNKSHRADNNNLNDTSYNTNMPHINESYSSDISMDFVSPRNGNAPFFTPPPTNNNSSTNNRWYSTNKKKSSKKDADIPNNDSIEEEDGNDTNKDDNVTDDLEQKLKATKIGEASSPSKSTHHYNNYTTTSHGFKLPNENSPKTPPSKPNITSPTNKTTTEEQQPNIATNLFSSPPPAPNTKQTVPRMPASPPSSRMQQQQPSQQQEQKTNNNNIEEEQQQQQPNNNNNNNPYCTANPMFTFQTTTPTLKFNVDLRKGGSTNARKKYHSMTNKVGTSTPNRKTKTQQNAFSNSPALSTFPNGNSFPLPQQQSFESNNSSNSNNFTPVSSFGSFNSNINQEQQSSTTNSAATTAFTPFSIGANNQEQFKSTNNNSTGNTTFTPFSMGAFHAATPSTTASSNLPTFSIGTSSTPSRHNKFNTPKRAGNRTTVNTPSFTSPFPSKTNQSASTTTSNLSRNPQAQHQQHPPTPTITSFTDLKFNLGSSTKKPPTPLGMSNRNINRNRKYTSQSNNKIPRTRSVNPRVLNATAPSTPNVQQQQQYPSTPVTQQQQHPNAEDDKAEAVNLYRTQGKEHYTAARYRPAVQAYSKAISEAKSMTGQSDEVLAILFGNRSAALLMLGAYTAAAQDVMTALATMPRIGLRSSDDTSSQESNIALKVKLLCRCGRANLKAGNTVAASSCFEEALNISESALKYHQVTSDEAKKVLNNILTDATLGKADLLRWKEAINNADVIESKSSSKNKPYHQILVHLNNALNISPASTQLHERKIFLLASMNNKWDEVAYHCEKLACENVKLDGIFEYDLQNSNPFSGVSPAKHLKSDFFDNVVDNSSSEYLNVSAVCEAVLRLPPSVLPLYFRSLRLEERYVESARASTALEVYAMDSNNIRSSCKKNQYAWLHKEREKLRRTISCKEEADNCFRQKQYSAAALKYEECLSVDEGEISAVLNGGGNVSGGRLHAILHCNRAACFMALEKHCEANKECTHALRIAPNYMKAILRRARCNSRLKMYAEALGDYQKWMRLVGDSRNPTNNSSTSRQCYFDKASDIMQTDIDRVKQEIEDVKKAKKDQEDAKAAAAAAARRKENIYTNSRNNNNSYDFRDFKQRFSNREQPTTGGSTNGFRRSNMYDDAYDGSSYKYNTRNSSKGRFGSGNSTNNNDDKHSYHGNGSSYFNQRNNNRGYHRAKSDSERDYAGHNNKQSNSSNNVTTRLAQTNCHYQVLSINYQSSSTEIKKAYHKMALKYHPDKNKEPEAAEIFRRVRSAYEVLSDDHARKKYDAGAGYRKSWR